MFVPPKHPNKPELFELARELRRQGRSVRHIAEELGVAKSTVSVWVRDIELTEAQRLENRRLHQSPEAIEKRCRARSDLCRASRLAAQNAGRLAARQGTPGHAAGCMLYWAEGTKDRNTLAFCDSDREMVRAFIEFLRATFALQPEDFTVRLNVYLGNGLELEEIEDAWLDALGLPPNLSTRTPDQSLSDLEQRTSHQEASLWRVHAEGPEKHTNAPAHLRCDSGVRGIRRAQVARVTALSPPLRHSVSAPAPASAPSAAARSARPRASSSKRAGARSPARAGRQPTATRAGGSAPTPG